MNVLFVVADDYRPQASIFGKPAITPNLDRIAARGVVFDRAYAQITVCNPSRNSFLTGKLPSTRSQFLGGTELLALLRANVSFREGSRHHPSVEL